MLRGGLAAIEPVQIVEAAARAHFRDATRGLFVIAAGKAAYGMTRGMCAAGVPIAGGLVAGPAPVRLQLPSELHWLDAAHPDPDEVSVEAGARALALAARSRSGTLVVLLSGGASAMLALPAPGIALPEKVTTAAALMRAGVGIAELNCVRKHLSSIKGGRLAAAASESVTLAISDVHTPVADDPSVIGSGPTVADPTSFADALRVVRGSGAVVPSRVIEHLERGAAGEIEETPKPDDPRLALATYEVIANRQTAMAGAADAARRLGYRVEVVRAPIAGEARIAGEEFARSALERFPGAGSCVIASGETIVHVRGTGRGGRNQEFALGAARAIAGRQGVVLASAGTDGIDGPTDAAGAVVDGRTVERASDAGLPVERALAENDAYSLFARLGDHVRWGRTGSNVGDLHVLLIA